MVDITLEFGKANFLLLGTVIRIFVILHLHLEISVAHAHVGVKEYYT